MQARFCLLYYFLLNYIVPQFSILSIHNLKILACRAAAGHNAAFILGCQTRRR
jgi:hypothetical protein